MSNPSQSSVAVLLPVRIETRFYPPAAAGATWRLRVLVIPDEPWINRHDPLPTELEFASLQEYYDAAPGGPATPEAKTAFQILAGRHGFARSQWLIRTFLPGQKPSGFSAPPRYAQIHGFPDELEMWIGRGGQPPALAAKWPVDPQGLDVSLPDPNKGEERWWSSWKQSVASGLGVEVDLGVNTPNDIDVLYVTGVGTTPADTLFGAHRDAGTLALIEPGTPTNSVDGAPAADLTILAADGQAERGSQLLSTAIAGKADSFGPIAGDSFKHGYAGGNLVSALWTVLWGHSLKDIWNLGLDVRLAGLWSAGNAAPEGPVPPVRVGDQPYGVLPATSLSSWQASPSDPQPDFAALEQKLAPYFALARRTWAQAAKSRGTVENADTARMLELLAENPSSHEYLYRFFISQLALETIYDLQPPTEEKPGPSRGFDAWWDGFTKALEVFSNQPARRYVSAGNPHNLQIPLVAPDSLPKDSFFSAVFTLDPWVLPSAALSDYQKFAGVESVLGRMLLQALIMSAADLYRVVSGQQGPALEPPVQQAQFTQMVQWALSLTQTQIDSSASHPAGVLYRETRRAIDDLRNETVGVLDRVLRATLDSACFRIDPWITAFAWRRLVQTSGPRPLGAYGWVDAPAPGQPGPTAGGLLHAPSEQQALTAAILRDKYLHDPEPQRWDMNLNSRSVRMADEIADKVRLGSHIQEVLGSEVERIAGSKPAVESLRIKYPIRASHGGRRVCDGEAVLKADPASLGWTPAQVTKLAELRAAVDSYADLLVAEAAYNVVAGRGSVAAAAMDAAAGLSGPPQLEVIETARTGRSVNSTVVVILPDAPLPDAGLDTSPASIADASVAAFLETTLGDAKSEAWLWEILRADGSVEKALLADFGFSPIDALALPEETLVRIVARGGVLNSAWRFRNAQGSVSIVRLSELGLSSTEIADLSDAELRTRAGIIAGQGMTYAGEEPAAGTISQQRARRIVGVLGERPAVPEDLTGDGAGISDEVVRLELLKRYEILSLLAASVASDLPSADPDTALLRAARWGIAPVAEEGETIAALVQKAADSLNERISASPTPADAAQLDAANLARAIASLAAPEARLAVLSRIVLPELPLKMAPDVLDDWLTINASVRAPMARLEGFQIDAEVFGLWKALASFSNRPGDAWQTKAESNGSVELSSKLVVAYAPGELPEKFAAAGVLDSWGEVIPDKRQATSVAFGFNAPAARPQQAVLVAVSPNSGPLNSSSIVDILSETRELAHARMATPADLANFGAALPMTMIALNLNPVK